MCCSGECSSPYSLPNFYTISLNTSVPNSFFVWLAEALSSVPIICHLWHGFLRLSAQLCNSHSDFLKPFDLCTRDTELASCQEGCWVLRGFFYHFLFIWYYYFSSSIWRNPRWKSPPDLRVHSPSQQGKAWQQEGETVGYIVSTVGKQREMDAGAQLSPFYSVQDSSP